jgi:molecular chaperone GrpE
MSRQDDDAESKGFTVNDRRWWLDDEKMDSFASDQSQEKKPSFVEKLQEEIEQKNRTLQNYIQAHKESKADMDEARGRLERELERRLDIEKARLAEPFIDVLDSLYRMREALQEAAASETLIEGMSLVVKQLEDRLSRIGIEPVVTSGERFDPVSMEALMTCEVEDEREGLVVQEIRPGYRLGDQVVRPAGVRVGVGKRKG